MTEPGPGARQRAARPRRGHAAAASRWAIGGLSAGSTLGLVTAMGWPAPVSDGPAPTASVELVAPPTTAPPAPAPVQRIVRVVRVDTSPRATAVASPPPPATPTRVVSAPAPAPPPPPPAPVARSSSS